MPLIAPASQQQTEGGSAGLDSRSWKQSRAKCPSGCRAVLEPHAVCPQVTNTLHRPSVRTLRGRGAPARAFPPPINQQLLRHKMNKAPSPCSLPHSLSPSFFHPIFLLASAGSKFPSFHERSKYGNFLFLGTTFPQLVSCLCCGAQSRSLFRPGPRGREALPVLPAAGSLSMGKDWLGQAQTRPFLGRLTTPVRGSSLLGCQGTGILLARLRRSLCSPPCGERLCKRKAGPLSEGNRERGGGYPDGSPVSVPSNS